MRVLLDNCVDTRVKAHLQGHDVVHCIDLGWEAMTNGNFLASAERLGFQAIVTVDKNMRHQQNFAGRNLSLIVLNSTFVAYRHLLPLLPTMQMRLDGGVSPGAVIVLEL
jgi:predicted nuclease of predicted toxin-antitoxin system